MQNYQLQGTMYDREDPEEDIARFVQQMEEILHQNPEETLLVMAVQEWSIDNSINNTKTELIDIINKLFRFTIFFSATKDHK